MSKKSDSQNQNTRHKNRVLFVILAAMIVLLYFVTMVKLS